jgi:hypothetical protein
MQPQEHERYGKWRKRTKVMRMRWILRWGTTSTLKQVWRGQKEQGEDPDDKANETEEWYGTPMVGMEGITEPKMSMTSEGS